MPGAEGDTARTQGAEVSSKHGTVGSLPLASGKGANLKAWGLPQCRHLNWVPSWRKVPSNGDLHGCKHHMDLGTEMAQNLKILHPEFCVCEEKAYCKWTCAAGIGQRESKEVNIQNSWQRFWRGEAPPGTIHQQNVRMKWYKHNLQLLKTAWNTLCSLSNINLLKVK